ncbi:MAG: hypothetical protein LBC86_02995 [Oscillospiraceae bacterium]|jgi:hypothetical protein|nr:hypothetical protein [Oscillospiraceae bacterium]
MKKLISVLLIAAVFLTFTVPAFADTLTTTDALAVLRAAAGLQTFNEAEMTRLGLSGTITTADALRILRIAAGLPAVQAATALRLNTDIFADLGLTVREIEVKRGKMTGGGEFVTFERGIGEYQFGNYKGERRSAHIWEIPASRLFANMGSSVLVSEIDIPGLTLISDSVNEFTGKHITYFIYNDGVNHAVHIVTAPNQSGVISSGDIFNIESDYYMVDFDAVIEITW